MFNKNPAHTIVYTGRGYVRRWELWAAANEGTLGAHGSGHGEFRLRRLRMGAKGEGHIQMSRSVIEGRSSQANGLVRLVALFGFALTLAGCSQSKPAPGAGLWDPKAAAAYLDRRMQWWIGWKNSARDHDTFCFSC